MPATAPASAASPNRWLLRAIWLLLISAAACAAWSYLTNGILFDLARVDRAAEWKVERLRTFFLQFGPLAPAVYLVFVTIEVIVAPIPGLLLYAPGGAIFGTLWGGALSLAGNTAGAGIACVLARSLQPRWMQDFFDGGQLQKLQSQLEARGSWVIFLLRINPLTSSDIVSYAAGLTRLPVWKVMAATCCGMAPLCFVQAWSAESLLTAFPQLLYPLAGMCVLYLAGVAAVLRRLVLRAGRDTNNPPETQLAVARSGGD